MSRKKFGKQRFTLIELLVSMAVFVIMLAMMLQFFVGAQRVWTGMEKRNDIYANGRVAMDIVTNLLQSQVSTEKNLPFVITYGDYSDADNNRKNDAICFFTKTSSNVGGGDRVRAVRFSMDGTDNTLVVRTLCRNDLTNKYESYFRAFGSAGGYASMNDSATDLESTVRSVDGSIVAERVTGFTIADPDNRRTSPSVNPPDTTTERVPKLVEVKLYMLDQKSFDIWKQMPASNADQKERRAEFLQQNERTFVRTVFFDDITETVN
uniref:PulJ/GspJ family protein n=1 Tax=Alistipes putredinis TaxID=28117 RepID=UPI003FD8A242